ncbi:hypothetical protein BO223_00565 [Faecalibaculum rodentium]|uniref:Uncharacterized protein n=1 Tax=Faecalibaculum rodentium TaxID=1702221 RepID=A0A140DV36_9FIRM|nr:hypothetical protein AALO17_13790 [Faecalibaculum rodentium]OLU47329.1 hypothetical protein BO223_00565 [Faecalibaculum rodentium]
MIQFIEADQAVLRDGFFNFSGSAAGREENDFHEFDDRTEKSGRRTKASTRREAYRNDQNFGAVR